MNQQEQAAAHLYTRFGFRLTETKPSAAFGKKLLEQRYELAVGVNCTNS
jgi:hypothetical protein